MRWVERMQIEGCCLECHCTCKEREDNERWDECGSGCRCDECGCYKIPV